MSLYEEKNVNFTNREDRIKKLYELKEKATQDIEKYRSIYGDYWEYFNCLIPLEVRSIPSKDRVNHVSMYIENGEVKYLTSLLRSNKTDYTLDEYRSKFCREEDGIFIWNATN
tara:strand:+ start:1326 stop:1664 length:339 start_codon:yes stop_codon:yes gene_type:complete